MTDPLVWSQDDTAQIVAVVTAALNDTSIAVTDGRAQQGATPPFVTCWQLAPELWGAGLGAECWGVANMVWQVSAHGSTQMEARWLAETISGYQSWPAGWELVDIGPQVEDTTDAPTTWFIPLSFVYRGTA